MENTTTTGQITRHPMPLVRVDVVLFSVSLAD